MGLALAGENRNPMTGLRRWSRFAILLSLIALCLSSGRLSQVSAQAEALTVVIDRPGEGEHLYAGPTTLLYSVPIAGWVYSATFEPSYITLKLEILQGETTILETPLRLGSDRAFSIHATVNPQSTFDPFSPQHGVNCESCHHGGTIDLIPGQLLIKVTASDPFGNKAIAERHVVVDHSGHATIPVQLEMQGASQASLAEIPVTAATRLYLWRTRYSTSLTDKRGQTTLQVEALSEAPTEYLIRVEPVIVNGTLYESIDPIRIILSAGAKRHSPVTLKIRSRMGEIRGHLYSEQGVTPLPSQIWAINLLSGKAFSAPVLQNARFAFKNLPYGQYHFALEPSVSEAIGIALVSEEVLLDQTSSMPISLPLLPANDRWLRARILDEQGHPLPFAWLLFEGQKQVISVLPEEGMAIGRLTPEWTSSSLQIIAPGMMPEQSKLEPGHAEQLLEFRLNRSADSQSLAWGGGAVIIPAESDVNLGQGRIRLNSGWLWGDNLEGSPLSIEIPSGQILIEQGRFALEYLPRQSEWLFLMEGEAQVLLEEGRKAWTLGQGQMIALVEGNYEGPVPLDSVALSVIRSGQLPAALRPTIASTEEQSEHPPIGTKLAFIVTFILIFILILLLLLPQLRKVRLKLAPASQTDQDTDKATMESDHQ